MNRAEAMVHFQENVANELCEAAKKEFHQLFIEKREVFAEKLKEGLKGIVNLLCERKEETEISYIHYSFLRAHVLDGTYEWFVEAQDEKGVFDPVERSITLSISEFFSPLQKLEEALKNQIHTYAGKITESDIEGIKLKEFNRYIGYFYIGGLKAFQNLKETDEYITLNKAPLFRITLGERKDKCLIVHLTLSAPMTEEEAQDKFYTKPDETDMQKQELTFQDYKGFHFFDRQIVFKNASYSSFQGTTLTQSEFMFCNFIGADFTGTTISNSYINVSTFQDACFRNAVIQDTVMAGNHFETAKYDEKKPIVAGLYPVSFQGALLKNVDFTGSDLSYCDFVGAKLYNINFSEAILEGAVFERDMASKLELTEEQRNSIILTVQK